jgi:hypothetical protein
MAGLAEATAARVVMRMVENCMLAMGLRAVFVLVEDSKVT